MSTTNSSYEIGHADLEAALIDAANTYVFTVGGVAVPAPLLPQGKSTPEDFSVAADTLYRLQYPDGHGEYDSPKRTITDRLIEDGVGIDCGGFVTSVLDRALSSMGLEAFAERIPHPDAATGYPVFPLDTLSSEPRYVNAAAQRATLVANGQTDAETRADYDMQRIVDNSTEVDTGVIQPGDVILYAPGDPNQDPKGLGHAAVVTNLKGGRVKVVHSGGRNDNYPGGVSGFSMPARRFTEPHPDRTPVSVRRLDVLHQ